MDLKKRRVNSFEILINKEQREYYINYLAGDGRIVFDNFLPPIKNKKSKSNLLLPEKRIYTVKIGFNRKGEYMFYVK